MGNSITLFKAKRLLRRAPRTMWREFYSPLLDRGQMLALTNAFVASFLILQTASIARMIEEIQAWAVAIYAFGITTLIWAIISAIRAPFVVIAEDRARGRWVGTRFLYNEPQLVFIERVKATGQPQFHKFHVRDAEPGSFVHFLVETDALHNAFTASVVSDIIPSMLLSPGLGAQSPGCRIGPKCEASLLVVMKENTTSLTIRVYAKDFSVGNPNDKDGAEGEFREAFRQTSGGDG